MLPAVLGTAAGVSIGVVVAAGSRGPTLVPWPAKVRAAFPFVVGGLTGAAVALPVGLGAALALAAGGRGSWPVKPVAVGLGVLGAGVVAGVLGRGQVAKKLTPQGRDLDPAYAAAPLNPLVSGSAQSAVSMTELGREGARFVGSVTSAETILAVTGLAPVAEPVRVFIGVDAAATVEQRVGLAMAELRRTGAFDRAHLLIQAPAGSGYANSTPVDVLEILTRGDTASVAIGYGLLPSFLSLDKVPIAAQTQKLLLDAITEELATRAKRPRLLLYGESLGAKVQEAAVPGGPIDLDHYNIAAALWVGTPGGEVADGFHALCQQESITVDRPEEIPVPLPTPRPRVWFLEHDGDPVVRFRPELLANRPAWLPLDGRRGRNIPDSMTWRPGITYCQALVDTLFATNVKPGDFQSLGHDYRADLGAVATAAYDLAADAATAARLETQLRTMEKAKAELIAQAGPATG